MVYIKNIKVIGFVIMTLNNTNYKAPLLLDH